MSEHRQVTFQLIPFSLATFLGFLAIGIPLPVLSLYVQNTLGFSPFAVGCIIGLQSLATLLTRQYAGRMCDSRGPKRTTMLGFASASVAGLLYLLSHACANQPAAALAVLALGRLSLGLGESLFITALASWSIVRVGPQHAGRAMAWSGIAMYGAIALGAPLGLLIYQFGGFDAVAVCAVISPCLGAVLAARWADAAVVASVAGASFGRVLKKIWAPGLSMALASSGVGTISAFLSLRYQIDGWTGAGVALTGFGVAYIIMRLLFGGVPDRLGGFRTGSVSLFVEAAGLLLIARASSPELALAGATLTGIGYSLIFPSLGVEALKRVPGENRGIVIGAYLACFDLGVAMAGPSAGLVARSFGLSSTFIVAAVSALIALCIVCSDRLFLSRARRMAPAG
jgi:predicted MFS family arabinose efflux permease